MARATVILKQFLQSFAARCGYRIERDRRAQHSLDVFDLAIRATQSTHGDEFFFVQIGANDGVSHDPIRQYIERFRWRGILVEPQPNVFERLKRNYASQPQLSFENAALAAHGESAILYSVVADDATTGMASFDRSLLTKQLPLGTKVLELSVPTLTLDALLRKHAVSSIHLLQIDAEGYDFEIIKMVDFSRVRPSVIHYEHRHLHESDRQACEELLAVNGYRVHLGHVDTTAVRTDGQ